MRESGNSRSLPVIGAWDVLTSILGGVPSRS